MPLLHPGKLGIFHCFRDFGYLSKRCLIDFPCFEIDGTYWPQGDFFRKNDSPGTFFLECRSTATSFSCSSAHDFAFFMMLCPHSCAIRCADFTRRRVQNPERPALVLSHGPFFFPPALRLPVLHTWDFLRWPIPVCTQDELRFYVFANVLSVEQKHYFSCFRFHSIDHDMQVIIVGLLVHPIDGLVPGQPNFFEENIHHFLHLFPCGRQSYLQKTPPYVSRQRQSGTFRLIHEVRFFLGGHSESEQDVGGIPTASFAEPKDKIYKLFDGDGLFLQVNPTGGKNTGN